MAYPITISQSESRLIELKELTLPISTIDLVDNTINTYDADYYVKVLHDGVWSAWARIADSMLLLATLTGVAEKLQIKITPRIHKYSLESITIDTAVIAFEDITMSLDNVMQASVLEIDTDLFDIYGQSMNAVNLMKAQTKAISDMFGHVMYYVHVLENEVDDTFKAVLNYKKNSIKPIKILVLENDFADSKIEYAEYGTSFDRNVKIHITTEEFERVFGVGMQPSAKDYLYMPQMGRAYSVTSSNAERHFMWATSFYECTLEKYVKDMGIDDAGVDESDFDVFTNFNIDNVSVSDDENNTKNGDMTTDAYIEERDVTKLHAQFFNLRTVETVRASVEKSVDITETCAILNGIQFIHKAYDLFYAINKEAIIYQKEIATDSTYTQWFMLQGPDTKLVTIGEGQYATELYVEAGVLKLTQDTVNHDIGAVSTSVWYMLALVSDIGAKTLTVQLFSRESEDDYATSTALLKLYDDAYALDSAMLGRVAIIGGTYLLSNTRCYNTKLLSDDILTQSITASAKIENSLFIDNVFDFK